MENQLFDCSFRAALMAAGIAVALGVLRIRVPAARHTAWTGMLVAMLLLPAWTAWGPKITAPVLPAIREELAPESPALETTPLRPVLRNAEEKIAADTNVTRISLEAGSPDHTKNWTWNWWWIALICYVA